MAHQRPRTTLLSISQRLKASDQDSLLTPATSPPSPSCNPLLLTSSASLLACFSPFETGAASDMAHEDFKYYYYTPSVGGALVALLVWLVLFSIHLWQAIRTRTKFFIPFLIGIFMEFVGYCGVCSLTRSIDAFERRH